MFLSYLKTIHVHESRASRHRTPTGGVFAVHFSLLCPDPVNRKKVLAFNQGKIERNRSRDSHSAKSDHWKVIRQRYCLNPPSPVLRQDSALLSQKDTPARRDGKCTNVSWSNLRILFEDPQIWRILHRVRVSSRRPTYLPLLVRLCRPFQIISQFTRMFLRLS
jgi:hypothetical protein